MGYRSDLMAVFYTTPSSDEALNKRNMATLDLFMEANFPAMLREPVTDYADGLSRDETKNRVVWQFKQTDVKWYDTYAEVRAFEEFWDKFVATADKDAEEGADPIYWACELIRLGENDDDIEQKASGACEYILNLHRSIDVNY